MNNNLFCCEGKHIAWESPRWGAMIHLYKATVLHCKGGRKVSLVC